MQKATKKFAPSSLSSITTKCVTMKKWQRHLKTVAISSHQKEIFKNLNTLSSYQKSDKKIEISANFIKNLMI